MQKHLKIGVILWAVFSCNAPTLKKTIPMYQVSFKFNEAAKGHKYLNYKLNPERVGEWQYEPEFVGLEDIPQNLTCFSTATWLKIVKPKLKEASRYFKDRK